MFIGRPSDIDVFDAVVWSEQRRPPRGHDVESEPHPKNNGTRGGALPPNQQREQEIDDAVENCPPARMTELVLERAHDLRDAVCRHEEREECQQPADHHDRPGEKQQPAEDHQHAREIGCRCRRWRLCSQALDDLDNAGEQQDEAQD